MLKPLITFGLFGGLLAAQTPGRQVVLSWTASPDPVGIIYNVYRAPGTCAPGQTFTRKNTAPVTLTSFTDANVPVGSYCYNVKTSAVIDGAAVESEPSNSVGATIIPRPPTGLTVTVQVAVDVRVNGIELARQEVTVPPVHIP